MPTIHVKGLDELVAKLRELASGKYIERVVSASRARIARMEEAEPQENAKNSPGLVGSRSALIGRQGLEPRQGFGPRRVMSLQQGRTRRDADAVLAAEAKRVEADLVDAIEEVLK